MSLPYHESLCEFTSVEHMSSLTDRVVDCLKYIAEKIQLVSNQHLVEQLRRAAMERDLDVVECMSDAFEIVSEFVAEHYRCKRSDEAYPVRQMRFILGGIERRLKDESGSDSDHNLSKQVDVITRKNWDKEFTEFSKKAMGTVEGISKNMVEYIKTLCLTDRRGSYQRYRLHEMRV